jgi:hypothetical protein
VAPDLATGAYPQDAEDVAVLRDAGVTTVLNLCDDVEYAPGARAEVERAYAAAGIVEHRLTSEDYGNLAPEVLEEGARVAGAALDAGERVYVHCRAGWQRSATVAAAALVVRDGLGPARGPGGDRGAPPAGPPARAPGVRSAAVVARPVGLAAVALTYDVVDVFTDRPFAGNRWPSSTAAPT